MSIYSKERNYGGIFQKTPVQLPIYDVVKQVQVNSSIKRVKTSASRNNLKQTSCGMETIKSQSSK